MKGVRIGVALAAALTSMGVPAAARAGEPSTEATCVGLASAFFGQQGIRDDVAHAIAARFGIPPGAEVSRFAHVQLGDTASCIANGQG
jgi:hypothetical protein